MKMVEVSEERFMKFLMYFSEKRSVGPCNGCPVFAMCDAKEWSVSSRKYKQSEQIKCRSEIRKYLKVTK